MWLVKRVREEVRESSLAVERRIKQGPPEGMPKDTGRAAASWGHFTPGDVRDNPDASAGDAIWDDLKDGGMTIVQGTNVEYVEALNAGHSQQSPAGFIDAAEDIGQRVLDRKIDEIMRQFGTS